MPTHSSPSPGPMGNPLDIRLKLAGIWTSTTLCYLYCDYLTLYAPGKLTSMLQGKMGPIGAATPSVLFEISILMAIPCVMVAFSLTAPSGLNRWVNLGAGLLFTGIMALLVPHVDPYYQFWGGLEILMTVAIVVLAARWPKRDLQ